MIPKPMNLFPNHHYNRARLYLILEIQAKKINCFMIAVKILIAKIRKIVLTMISRLVKSGRDVNLIKRTEKDKGQGRTILTSKLSCYQYFCTWEKAVTW